MTADVFNELTDNRGALTVAVIVVVAVIMVAAAAWFLVKLLRKYRLVHSQFAPLGAKLAFWGALAYTFLPLDVLPDPLLFDDIGVLLAAITYINHALKGSDADDPSTDTLG